MSEPDDLDLTVPLTGLRALKTSDHLFEALEEVVNSGSIAADTHGIRDEMETLREMRRFLDREAAGSDLEVKVEIGFAEGEADE